MAKAFSVSDHVQWNIPQSVTTGPIEKKLAEPILCAGPIINGPRRPVCFRLAYSGRNDLAHMNPVVYL
jgi:hypothetical protein